MDVLIVDNEPAFAELLAARLELQGYSARSAGSGEEALKKLKERPCDVALLGVHLVGMSGLELLSRMRRKWPQTPCIMLTELAQAEQGAEAMRFGAYDWLAKPVSMASVESALERALGRQKAERQHELYAEAARMRTLERLTQGIAHEVNNPVNIMLQAAGEIEDILMEDEMQSVPRPLLREMDGAIATIKRQSRRVRELTGTLLVLGRGLDKESRAVNLAEVTEEVFGMFRTRLEDCGVEALMRIDPAMPAFLGSRLEMRQVLLHLVENAIDAMPDGGKLTVEGRVRTVEGGSEETLFGDGTDGSTGKVVEIRVRDTGEVIPEAVRGDIFQPFFTTREVGKGKGLGLAVCKSLVETRQGRIELEKSLPGNTCFRILLPFEKVPA